MKQTQFKKAVGAGAILAGAIAASAPLAARADIYSAEFAAEAASPRSIISTQPAAFLFADVNFADEPAASSSDDSRPARRTRTRQVEDTTTTSSSSGKSGKDAKEIIGNDVNFVSTGPVFSITTGWDSVEWWHGEDNVAKSTGAANRKQSSPVWYARAAVEWKGFALYAGYLQSDDKVQPRDFDHGPMYYGEFQTGVSYTIGIVKNVQATIGYNAYFFNSDAYLGHNFQGEAFAKVAYTGISFLTPSLAAYNLHTGDGATSFNRGFFHIPTPGGFDLDGWIYEARLDANVKLFSVGQVTVNFNPYVTLVFDDQYWSNQRRFNDVEYGLNFPIVFSKNITLNLHANFQTPCITRKEQNDPSLIYNPRFWGGASITYKF